MVPFNLKVLAKYGLCSNCSQKLDVCSLARARKRFATAHMLGFLLKFSAVYSGSIICILETKIAAGNNVSRMAKLRNARAM